MLNNTALQRLFPISL